MIRVSLHGALIQSEAYTLCEISTDRKLALLLLPCVSAHLCTLSNRFGNIPLDIFPQDIWLAVWLSGNALGSINVVALRQTRLVPGWMTVYGRVNRLGM